MPHLSVTNAIVRLKDEHPDTPFIALGQTVFWDEPVKAAWRRILDSQWPQAQMIAAVHDTDYFAKTSAHFSHNNPYAMVEHNDGDTRDLWSAAGEMSTLFGSEDIPTRQVYERFGAPFSKLASCCPQGKTVFFRKRTAAWGWRGLVHVGSYPPISRDISLSEFIPALLEQLHWGFNEALHRIDEAHRAESERFANNVIEWVRNYACQAPDNASLSDLYCHILPKFYEALLGEAPKNLKIDRSTDLFLFNTKTYQLPRFRIAELFVDPKTRAIATDAYNKAVIGGGMYGLDSFGEGAIPFDIALPGHGRGSIRIFDNRLVIDWRGGSQEIASEAPIESLRDLAKVVEDNLGEGCALIGKAVPLIDMLGAEFIVLFHETASAYSQRTGVMNKLIRATGIALDLKPIVRIAYPTWDALRDANLSVRFLLPPHLSKQFENGDTPISASDFAKNWRSAVNGSKELLKEIENARGPRALMQLLEKQSIPGSSWPHLAPEYEGHLSSLAQLAYECLEYKKRVALLKEQIKVDRRNRVFLELDKGIDFRKSLFPLLNENPSSERDKAVISDRIKHEETRRIVMFDQKIDDITKSISDAKKEIRRLRAECKKIERSNQARIIRERIDEIIKEAELGRIDLIRSAYISSASLPHTQARPSAWWLPFVDSSGRWFNAITEGLSVRFEEL
jgi:hypothetical protein